MRRGVKKKDYENLTATNIQKVIGLLNPTDGGSPISKKEACEILNIAYNTTRLDKIIAEHLERREYVKKRKAMNRGRPASDTEIGEAVAGYLRGEPINEIAAALYRSPAFIKALIDRVGVPERTSTEDSLEYDYIPEQCVAESFEAGEIVWSAKYHSAAIIEKELSVDYQAEKPGFLDVNYEKKYSSKCYAIYVLTRSTDDDDVFSRRKPGFYAYALAYDLAKLEHLKQYGVDLSTI